MNIEKAKDIDIEHVASLHREYIKTGFLSSLGLPFLALMYRSMSNSNNAICLVAKVDDKIIGFSSGAISVGAFYKDFLRRNFIKTSMMLLPKIIDIRFVKKIFETLLYPAKKEQNLPKAELLSIVVDVSYRGKGTAQKLFVKLEEEFRSRNVKQFKVIVGSKLIAACRFYEKMGGVFSAKVEVHKGEKSRVYVWEM